MQDLSSLVGVDCHWQMDASSLLDIPRTGQRHFVCYSGQDPVLQAQASWAKRDFLQAILEFGEGTYLARVDLTSSVRQSVAWKAGHDTVSVAGFVVSNMKDYWSGLQGIVTTASGHHFRLCQIEPPPPAPAANPYFSRDPHYPPAHAISYGLYDESGVQLLTIQPPGLPKSHVRQLLGVHDALGTMQISPALQSDSELPALVALAFALGLEQALALYV